MWEGKEGEMGEIRNAAKRGTYGGRAERGDCGMCKTFIINFQSFLHFYYFLYNFTQFSHINLTRWETQWLFIVLFLKVSPALPVIERGRGSPAINPHLRQHVTNFMIT
jgi:hypothetical protein